MKLKHTDKDKCHVHAYIHRFIRNRQGGCNNHFYNIASALDRKFCLPSNEGFIITISFIATFIYNVMMMNFYLVGQDSLPPLPQKVCSKIFCKKSIVKKFHKFELPHTHTKGGEVCNFIWKYTHTYIRPEKNMGGRGVK